MTGPEVEALGDEAAVLADDLVVLLVVCDGDDDDEGSVSELPDVAADVGPDNVDVFFDLRTVPICGVDSLDLIF